MHRLIVRGTENVLHAAIAANVRRFVYLSSSLVQACETGMGDITDYGQSKLEAERLVMAAHVNQQIEATILRPVNVYGAGMKGNIASMISLIARRLLPPLPKLNNEFSLLGVDDLVNALVLAAESSAASGKSYFVTDGVTYRINDIERAIYKALGRNRPGWYSPRMVLYAASVLAGLLGKLKAGGTSISARTYTNLVNDNCFSSQQIQDDLGFSPSGNLYKEMPALVEHLVK
jgi:nucleoside-diphosphate-sugar epimerase